MAATSPLVNTLDIERDMSLSVFCMAYPTPQYWSEVSEEMPSTRAE